MANRHPMLAADAAWLHMDRPTNPMVINSVLWFDQPLEREIRRLASLD
jgi:diacylglycerol O-acyltransferase / wax synthase